MKKVIMLLFICLLTACSSNEQYDCHIVTKHHTWTQTKLCDGYCSPMFKITNIKEQIKDEHKIIKRGELKQFMESEYESAEMVNGLHDDFIKETGKYPIQIIKLDCRKL